MEQENRVNDSVWLCAIREFGDLSPCHLEFPSDTGRQDLLETMVKTQRVCGCFTCPLPYANSTQQVLNRTQNYSPGPGNLAYLEAWV